MGGWLGMPHCQVSIGSGFGIMLGDVYSKYYCLVME
jgi:hypothetical protein